MTASLKRHEPAAADEPESSGGKRWTLIVALVVVGVMAVLGLYVVLFPADDSGPAEYSGPVVAVQAPAVVPGGVCNFPKVVEEPVTIAPTDVTWELAGSMATPGSVSAGPLSRGGSAQIPVCYARSPQGALLAAANWVTTMQNPKVDKAAAVTALVARTGGFDTMQSYFEGANAGAAAADVPSVTQIAGFRMLFFDQSHAEMEIVTRATSGNSPGFMASVVYVLVWEKDDWKIAPVLDGNAPITRVVDALTPPYIPFNGA